MYFHEYSVDFDGDLGAFDESGSYNFVPNKRPPFSLFSKRPGRLKGGIRYFEAKTRNLLHLHITCLFSEIYTNLLLSFCRLESWIPMVNWGLRYT